MKDKCMWELLVPTVWPNSEGKRFFRTKFHRVWDRRVRDISGGLTIMAPSKGQWVSPHGTLFTERMIPVRIIATRPQIDEIINFTLQHYSQEAVLCYRISDEVLLRYSDIRNNS
jgi:hypothetical protein